MKSYAIALLAAVTAATVSPLAAAVDCGSCGGSLLCPTPPPCPPNARHVSLPPRRSSGPMSIIQNAINSAPSGAVICVGPGTYLGNLNFGGKPVIVKSSTPLGAILNGNGIGPVVSFVSNESSLSVLDGFQVTGGSSSGGGGIRIVNASPIVQNCLIKGNTAPPSQNNTHPRGGGVLISGNFAAPSILCSCLQGNHADFAGGGISTNYLAHPYLNMDTFAGNSASYGAGYSAAFSGLANIENSTFVGNSASVDGAALHVQSIFGSTLVRRTLFQNNKAAGVGGAVWVPDGFATILNSVFDGNSGGNGGAAATGYDGVLTVESSILVHNRTGNSTSATLAADTTPVGTTLINNFNLFFGNTGGLGDFTNTTGNAGILTAHPSFGSCYALNPGSPALNTGLPGPHFTNPNSTRNDMGMWGGPVGW